MRTGPPARSSPKNAVAFAHTGLLFLLARTPDAPAVKEVKPAAMIGYRAVEVRPITGRDGQPKPLFTPQLVRLEDSDELPTRQPVEAFTPTGDVLEMTVVNTGENGLFAKGEFGAITALQQMEFVTPEEIAQNIVMELVGGNTGKDVLAALDGAVMTSSYRAGQLRTVAMKDLQRIEDTHDCPSIALGELGPPELSKLLFEAWLLRDKFGEELLGCVQNERNESAPAGASNEGRRGHRGLEGRAASCLHRHSHPSSRWPFVPSRADHQSAGDQGKNEGGFARLGC